MSSSRDLVAQLHSLGVKPGGVLVVHTAFSRIRPIEGGPVGLIGALRDALGADGTLVMPSMSDDDEHPFDASATPCRGLGVVADTFWRMPGVLRSNNPHAFAAIGPRAEAITRPHPIDVPHGIGSPIGRVFELGGQVLLLGVGHDANTTVHLAENLAGVRYGLHHHVTIDDGGATKRLDYFEIDHCCEGFAQLDEWLGARQRRGVVGHGPARLMESRDVVEVALQRLRENETVFLHEPAAACNECDEARSLHRYRA
jgi:aminoglycoside N3'-acetyltransferase